jgi:hypothetical protein
LAGLARGGAHLAQGAARAVQFTETLIDPSYGLLHGGQPAGRPLAQGADNTVRQGWSAARHPIRAGSAKPRNRR